MKQKLLLIWVVVIVFACSPLNAQLKFGIRGGINDNVRLKTELDGDTKIKYSPGTLGFHFGLTSQLKIASFFVQPELLFSTNKNDVDVTYKDNLGQVVTEASKHTYNKLDVPVLFGLKMSLLKLEVGPVFTAVLQSKSELFEKEGWSHAYNNATVGYQLGAGIEGKKLGLELRYEGSLKSYGTKMKINNKSFDIDNRPSQLILTAAYYF